MAAIKEKETEKQLVALDVNCSDYISYYMLMSAVTPINRIYVKNLTDEDLEDIHIKIYSKPAFLLNKTIEQPLLPRRSTVRFDSGDIISPVYMVALDHRVEGEIFIQVIKEKKVLAEERLNVSVLAFNECFTKHTESLATFVRKTKETKAIAIQAEKKMAEWKVKKKDYYQNSTKNDVRYFFAAVYSVLSEYNFIQAEQEGDDVLIGSHEDFIKNGALSSLELALLYAGVLESVGINCLFGKSGGSWYVGAFLSDECLGDAVIDDSTLIENKIEKGVNDISMVSIPALFDGMTFESNEKKTVAAIKKNGIEFFIDIKYSRMTNIRPLPERVKVGSGYDIVDGSEYKASAAMPDKIVEYRGSLSGDKNVTREKQWERRLLELDMRNALLNFKISSYTIKILSAKLEDFVRNLPLNKSYQVKGLAAGDESLLTHFGGAFEKTLELKPVQDLLQYEFKNKHLRTKLAGKEFDRAMVHVYRREKSRQEELGTTSLYLAAGFVRWCEKDQTELHYAPILLYPVTLSRRGSAVTSYFINLNEDEVHINTTLLEYLYQQFDVDIRGLADIKLGSVQSVISALARFKKEISVMKGWSIYDSVYLCSLSFSNYLMWNDVRTQMDKFKESKVIRSLLTNRNEFSGSEYQMESMSSDGAYTEDDDTRIYLPISADSSQYSAVKDSLSKSFVLHGPPGTGKSQTITNMIANNIVRGRKVLFVAEKMAALSVVYKRLKDIGIGDFCLELYSEKTKKTEIVDQIVATLAIAEKERSEGSEQSREEMKQLIERIQGQMEAIHKKHALGFSVYEGILNYLDNADAPDCLTIDSLFYEKLSKESFNRYINLLTELAMRAKECGNIEKSPFKDVGKFDYNAKWRVRGEAALNIYYRELKNLRAYARKLVPIFNMRTVAFTWEKLKGLYTIAKVFKEEPLAPHYFKENGKYSDSLGVAESYITLKKQETRLVKEFENTYGSFPSVSSYAEIVDAAPKEKEALRLARKYSSATKLDLDKNERMSYFQALLTVAKNRVEIEAREARLMESLGVKESARKDLLRSAENIKIMIDAAKDVYADFNAALFYESCRYIIDHMPVHYLDFYMQAYEGCGRARELFECTFDISEERKIGEINQEMEYVMVLIKNLDLIGGWCKYQEIVEECRTNGFEFVLEPLNVGEITADDILRCFKKCIYQNFIRSEISLDSDLCQFSGLAMEEMIERFKQLSDEYERLTRQELHQKLVDAVPRPEDEGAHNLEKVILLRAQKNNMKGITLRKLFTQIPTILRTVCPCMLMSPASVTQFLEIDLEKFDLVIFDEASQVPTCKAVGTIARANQVIVVGDPKQLPPTSFFGADFKDEEHLEVEDLDSILDDCLALGMPERHLLWHYRSHHESLIAFSNAMFYDNTLLTFPSPNEMNSKVTLNYVDGVYERGGTKYNRKEAQELIKEVIFRLKDPVLKNQSIGVVTFNTAQQNHIEDCLTKALREHKLEIEAYERDEPLFVKNLENVQGDERDVILFSVGYGPDTEGKLSLNFGPLNQAGGYRRLNVAVTRARIEMKIFTSILSNMIDLNRTASLGVKGLKSFLEYAERGREMLVFDAKNIAAKAKGIGEYIAKDLKERGIDCVYDLGVSDFKIDVAVVDPRDKSKYILAIICDSRNEFKIKSVRDRVALQTKFLKTLGWNVYYLWTINYFGNPKREIAKIKDTIAELAAVKVVSKKSIKEVVAKYRKKYKAANFKPLAKAGADYVLSSVNEEQIKQKINAIIKIEEPIDEVTLLEKLLPIYNVPKTARKAVAMLTQYIDDMNETKHIVDGTAYFMENDCETFRPFDATSKRNFARVYPYEIIAAARCALETRSSLNEADLTKEIAALMNLGRRTKPMNDKIEHAIALAVKDGFIIRTVEGIYTV